MNLEPPIVVIPMARWDKIAEKALRFGMTMSTEVKVVHVDSDDARCGGHDVGRHGAEAAAEAGLPEPELITVKSNYRTIISPLMDVVLKLEEEYPR